MERKYEDAAAKLPHQALAISLCEMSGIGLEHVSTVDIHCPTDSLPTVTFAGFLRISEGTDVAVEVARYELRPVGPVIEKGEL